MTCACTLVHPAKRVVLTGGPGAGKTAVLEMMRKTLCQHVQVVPEAASVVFGGGFPRVDAAAARRAAQRAIFYVQRELEAAVVAQDVAIALCDRGTVDGSAYWSGDGELWREVDTTLDEQLGRYAAVIHLRTPALERGYNHRNPLRIESAVEAAALDARIADAWAKHFGYDSASSWSWGENLAAGRRMTARDAVSDLEKLFEADATGEDTPPVR